MDGCWEVGVFGRSRGQAGGPGGTVRQHYWEQILRHLPGPTSPATQRQAVTQEPRGLPERRSTGGLTTLHPAPPPEPLKTAAA